MYTCAPAPLRKTSTSAPPRRLLRLIFPDPGHEAGAEHPGDAPRRRAERAAAAAGGAPAHLGKRRAVRRGLPAVGGGGSVGGGEGRVRVPVGSRPAVVADA